MESSPPPALAPDPIIDVLKRDVDRTLLRENLQRTPEERLLNLQRALDGLAELRKVFGVPGR
jgi:hypothetical protein